MVEETVVVLIAATEGMIIGKVIKDTIVTTDIATSGADMTAEIMEEAEMKAEGMTVAAITDTEEVEVNHLIIK
ncbi:hypothetical protein AQ505_18005 [Pedobacter sp. PACM 27299]|nr:hypothetical protein AQ505_18005 [Pedobacter sp. PACM 27299]